MKRRSKLQLLTPREREVLDGLAKGLPNKSIGYDLNISPRTVEIHRANLMTQVGSEEPVRSAADRVRSGERRVQLRNITYRALESRSPFELHKHLKWSQINDGSPNS